MDIFANKCFGIAIIVIHGVRGWVKLSAPNVFCANGLDDSDLLRP